MKELEWGQTPWDNLSREELLREVQRMASALISAGGVLRMLRGTDESHPFWREGTGARAVHKAVQALHLMDAYESEDVYRSFFRYADDLLFQSVDGVEIGFGWAVCPVCGDMFGGTPDGKSSVGTPCAAHLSKTCPGILRPIEWGDLAPQVEVNE